jgi:hypothetical protein
MVNRMNPSLERAAKEYSTKTAQTWRGDKMVSERPVVDPDEYDAFIAGAKWAFELAAQEQERAGMEPLGPDFFRSLSERE